MLSVDPVSVVRDPLIYVLPTAHLMDLISVRVGLEGQLRQHDQDLSLKTYNHRAQLVRPVTAVEAVRLDLWV